MTPKVQESYNKGPMDLKEKLSLKEMELNSLLEITQAVQNNLPEEALYKIFHFTLLGSLNVSKFALYTYQDDWQCRATYGANVNCHLTPVPNSFLEFSNITSVNKVENAGEFKEFDYFIPVKHKDTSLAYLFMSGQRDDTETHLSFLQTICNILMVSIENKRFVRNELAQRGLKKELEIAHKVQNLLFPKTLPKTKEVRVDAYYHPHHVVGGDYYDYLELADGRLMVCIADISGKGVPAALLMSNFQASLHAIMRHNTDLDNLVRELNMLIKKNADGENFITAFVSIIDREKKTIQYVNAGHNPPYVTFEDGRQLTLDKGTTILGVFDKLPFLVMGEEELPEDFHLFACTDGLLEARGEKDEADEYGEERLMEFLKDNFEWGENSVDKLLKALADHNGGQPFHDDITFISCKVHY